MKYITLVCAAGMSTSLLVNKMRRVAAAEKLEVEITAMADVVFQRCEKQTDVLLLGPQVRYKYEELKDQPGMEGIPAAVIDSQLYATMDAETVLHMAMDMLEKTKEKNKEDKEMKKFTYVIKDEVGLHARPAGLLVKKAKELGGKITVSCNGKSAEATRLMAIMGMGVMKDMEVEVTVEGENEEAAAAELEAFFKENL